MSKIYTKETLIDALKEIRSQGWIKSGRKAKNVGAVGNTLEDLLGIEENNLPIPNAAEWELKTQRKETNSLVTLFHSEPSPRALNIVPWLLSNYGWKHKEAGKKYPKTEKSFRQTINYLETSSRGFSVKIDDNERKILVAFSFNDISSENSDWKKWLINNGRSSYDSNHIPYWGFDDLFHKAGTKLKNCFYVSAESKIINDGTNKIEYFKYADIKMLAGFDLNKFIEAIRLGYIYIDFDARTGHNHGTKFRIRRNKIPFLYKKIKEI